MNTSYPYLPKTLDLVLSQDDLRTLQQEKCSLDDKTSFNKEQLARYGPGLVIFSTQAQITGPYQKDQQSYEEVGEALLKYYVSNQEDCFEIEEIEDLESINLNSEKDLIQEVCGRLEEPESKKSSIRKVCEGLNKSQILKLVDVSCDQYGKVYNSNEQKDLKTKGGIFFKEIKKLRKKGLESNSQFLRDQITIRKHQVEAIEKALLGQNLIISSCTGSGKTEIFLEFIYQKCKSCTRYKTVLLCPTVQLVIQQATRAVSYDITLSDKVLTFDCESLSQEAFNKFLSGKANIVVCTPQMFSNIVLDGPQNMSRIDLLVIDEVHNAKKKHPLVEVINMYPELCKKYSKAPQVIGLSATPSVGKTKEQIQSNMDWLLLTLQAKYVLLMPENGKQFQPGFVTNRKIRTVCLNQRNNDLKWQVSMGKLLYKELSTYSHIKMYLPTGDTLDDILQHIEQGQPTFRIHKALQKVKVDILDRKGGLKAASIEKCIREFFYLQILIFIHQSLYVQLDIGWENGQNYVNSELQCMTDITIYQKSKADILQILESTDHDRPAFSNDPKKLLQRYFQNQVFEDLYNDYMKYLKTGNVVLNEKLIEVVKILRTEIHDKNDFKVIIFVKTKYGAKNLCRILKSYDELKGVEFSYLTGTQSIDSINAQRQRQIMDDFRLDGRKVLISTSVAEEGIDIPACGIVINFAPSVSGHRRIQSQGRARLEASRFIELCYHGFEEILLRKALREEAVINNCTLNFQVDRN